jgi:hypothetical protein
MGMAPGKQAAIEYRNWDNTPWTATLQNVSTQISGPFGKSTIDPDFHHVGPGNVHDAKWIHYFAWNGGHWASQCHSHTGGDGRISFTFEHFRQEDLDHSDHEDATIGFIGWDGTLWLANAPDVGPIPDGQSAQVLFNLEKRS